MKVPKDKALMDSADYLARRQSEVYVVLRRGIRGGGLPDDEWARLDTRGVVLATRGHVSERVQAALDLFDEHRLYTRPRRLRQLSKLLRREFNAAQRIYTNKGLLTLAPAEEVKVTSTLSGEAPMMDEVPEWLIPADEENEKT